jgi:restriction system protein
VRELYGVIAAERAAGGFVVTSGTFTDEARRFAEGREIELINGEQLAGAIRQQAAAPRIEPTLRAVAAPPAQVQPNCPKCNSAMVLRTAKTGSRAGESFWGCSRFPECRGTRPA